MTGRKKNDEPFPKADRAEAQADGAPGTAAERGGPEVSPEASRARPREGANLPRGIAPAKEDPEPPSR